MTNTPLPMRIAAIQMISGPDVTPNLRDADRLIGRAAREGAKLVVLPEYFPLIGASDADRLLAREPDGAGPIQDFLSSAAARHGVWLVGGSLPMVACDPAKMRNACLVYDDTGSCVARYDKIHLFAFRKGAEAYEEAATIESGSEVVAFDAPFGRVGLAICYDLRFPELYSALAKDCDVLINIANWPKRRVMHWRTLLQARAIENQTFVIGVNRIGADGNGLEYERSSVVVNANGEFIEPVFSEGEMDIYEISRQALLDFRQGFSTRQDRLPDLYRALI